MLVDSLTAGKHVYLDGCLGQNPEDTARAIQGWQRSGQVVQLGLQNRSHSLYRHVRELIDSGVIGRVHEVRATVCRPSPDRDPDWAAACGALSLESWKSFLAEAPACAVERRRLFRWRNYWDYSADIASDLLRHSVDTATFGIIRSAPSVCRASGALYAWANSDRELPDHFNLYYEYENQLSVTVSARLDDGEAVSSEEFLGTTGSVAVHDAKSLTVYRREPGPLRFATPRIRDHYEECPEAPVAALDAHLANFLEAIRGREHAVAAPSTVQGCMAAMQLAAMSYRANAPAIWNGGRPRLSGV
jgi:predicted dehydrogenase